MRYSGGYMASPSIHITAVALVGTLLASHSALLAQRPVNTPRPAAQTLEIITVPRGLTVHFGPDTSTVPLDTAWVPMVTSHPLLAPGYRRGVAPVTVRDVKAGRYLIAVSPLAVLDRNLESLGVGDPFLPTAAIFTFRRITTFPPMKLPLDSAVSGALIYGLTVSDDAPRRIVVFASSASSLAMLDSLYPSSPLFAFDTLAFMQAWRLKTASAVSDAETRRIVGLLRRGGRIMVTMGDLRFRVLIKPDRTWDISIQARLPQKAER